MRRNSFTSRAFYLRSGVHDHIKRQSKLVPSFYLYAHKKQKKTVFSTQHAVFYKAFRKTSSSRPKQKSFAAAHKAALRLIRYSRLNLSGTRRNKK